MEIVPRTKLRCRRAVGQPKLPARPGDLAHAVGMVNAARRAGSGAVWTGEKRHPARLAALPRRMQKFLSDKVNSSRLKAASV
jgi:hypothetical protein